MKSLFFNCFFALLFIFPANVLCVDYPKAKGDLVYRDSEGKIYGRDGNSCLDAPLHPGHVGIYIGNDQVIEAVDLYGKIMINPLTAMAGKRSFYDADGDGIKEHNPLGAKTHKKLLNNANANVLRDSIERHALNQLGERYDSNFFKQKGPGNDDWTCVGFAEKIYESAGSVNLVYHDDYGDEHLYSQGLNITPDGYDYHFSISNSTCYYQDDVEFSQIAKTLIIGRPFVNQYFIFFPWTQFNQVTLIDSFKQPEINPTIAQTPMEGPIGTSCRQWGTGFTSNSTGKLYFQLANGSFDEVSQSMDSDGHFDIGYVFNKPPGKYTWYGKDVTGKKSNEVTYTITGSTTSSTPTAYPSSGTWSSSPQNISVSCGSADRIYCTVRTAYGSIPEDPPTPTIESHDFFDTGVEYIGSSGTFKAWGQSGQLKYIKVRFRGYNSHGYGPSSGVYLYSIDLRNGDPGDDGTSKGPDANVKKVEIDNEGNNWHHSYNAYPGQRLESRVTVTNKGDETIDYFEVTIYRSNDKNFNKDNDYKYGREEEKDDLDPGEKDHKHRTITAPSTPGTYYIFAYINRVDGEDGGNDQDWSNNYSRDDDVEEYAKLTVYPWPPPNWSIVKEESSPNVHIFYNNRKWWATSWEILSALNFKSEDLIIYPDGKLSGYSSGPAVLGDGLFGELNSCTYLFESGKWHYLPNWSYMDCKGGQHPENVIPITQALFNMYAGGADVGPCIQPVKPEIIAIINNIILGDSIKTAVCPNCSGTDHTIRDVTFYGGTNCKCVGTKSLTIGPGVTIQKDAKVTFEAPKVRFRDGVKAKQGASVKVKQN